MCFDCALKEVEKEVYALTSEELKNKAKKYRITSKDKDEIREEIINKRLGTD